MKQTCKECGQLIRCDDKFKCPHCKKEISSDVLDGMCWDRSHSYNKSKLMAITLIFFFILLSIIVVAKTKSYSSCTNTGWGYQQGVNQLKY